MSAAFQKGSTEPPLERVLQSEGQCTAVEAVKTPYNNDDRVPTYMGIMFTVFSRANMELLTMELDVRIPKNETNPDLSIEVYTMKGSFENYQAYGPDRWTLVAETTGIILEEGEGVLIPTEHFDTVQIKSGEKRSFYVTMKKSYIDHTVVALDKTGELTVQTNELDIFVGVGFHEYKFPGDFDRTLDPQFAGVLHLNKTEDCHKMVTTTSVEYSFLVDQQPSAQIQSQINANVETAIKAMMNQNPALKSYQKYYFLQKNGETFTSTVIYDGKQSRANTSAISPE